MLTSNTKELRLKLYRELEEVYHRFFDELAESDLPNDEVSKLAQAILLSNQEVFSNAQFPRLSPIPGALPAFLH